MTSFLYKIALNYVYIDRLVYAGENTTSGIVDYRRVSQCLVGMMYGLKTGGTSSRAKLRASTDNLTLGVL